MKTRKTNSDAPFQTIERAAALTGLPQSYLRRGCREGRVPFIRSGRCYLVNVPALLRLYDGQDAGSREEAVQE